MMQKGDPFAELLARDAQPAESSDARSHQLVDALQSPMAASAHATERGAASSTRRRAKPKPQPSDTELQGKRKRHADAERERIHRKQSGVLRMRDEVAQLEQQLHSLSTSSVSPASSTAVALAHESAMTAPWHAQIDETTFSLATTALEKRDLYVRALTESGWLRREKASLQAKLDDCGLLEATVESLLKDLIDATINQPTPPNPRDAADETRRHISYRDVLSDECYDMMRDLVSESKRFTIHPEASALEAPTSVNVRTNTDIGTDADTSALDWSASCQHDHSDVRFSLTKTFGDADLDQLASSAWLAFHDVEVSRKIFSPTIRVEVLQRISDDILIVRWQIDCRKAVPYVGHCRNLVFRWKTPDGYFVGCRTIDELEPMDPSMVKSNPTNGAFDQFYWAKFTHDPSGRGCQVTFAGRVGVGNGTSAFARFLCTEIPISIFRWESLVVGPLFNFEPSVVV